MTERLSSIDASKRPSPDALPASARLTRSGKIKVRTATPSSVATAAVLVFFVVMTAVTFANMGYGSTTLAESFSKLAKIMQIIALEPRLDGHFAVAEIAQGMAVTICLSILVTLAGSVLALVVGVLAAENLTNRRFSTALKAVLSVIRAIPTIVWVLVFTVAMGPGSEACVVGMLLHTVAFLGKAYSEEFEECDPGVLEALRATGASRLQVIVRGVFLEKLNEIISWTFIRFENNFVNGVVVGAVAGAGGIGYQLYVTANFYIDYHEVGLITYLCLAVSVVLELAATKLRKRLVVRR